jgi:transmembrane sensor
VSIPLNEADLCFITKSNIYLMKKSRARLDELLEYYFNQDISDTDKDELWEYVLDPLYEEQINTQIPDTMSNIVIDQDGLSEKKQNNILDHIFQYDDKRTTRTVVNLWRRIGIAAAIATIIVGIGMFYYSADRNQDQDNFVANTDKIEPGKQGATLTLANGKKIRLSDVTNGELAKEAGVSVSKTADGQLIYEIVHQDKANNKLNTLSTANGETYQIHLPDGSSVVLNAASSLTYTPNLIKDGRRIVTLKGEAYFKVAKDKVHPFIVRSKGQEIAVLGTEFNVNAYDDDSEFKATLIEGSVKLNEKMVLKPGEQFLFNGAKGRIVNADVKMETAWKDGFFQFERVDIQTLMRQISRWYDIEIEYRGDIPKDELVGKIKRDEDIKKVLEILKYGNVKFQLVGRKLIVG